MAVQQKAAWDALFRGYAQRKADKDREAAREQQRSAWFEAQTLHVMQLLREVALERSASFEQQTGAHIDVRWPSRAPINVAPEGPFMSFLSLGLGDREVHLYSHRVTQKPPTIHYVVTGTSSHALGHKRVHGRPGCRIEERAGGGFLLRDLATSGQAEGSEIGVEDLSFRAFEALLAGAHHE